MIQTLKIKTNPNTQNAKDSLPSMKFHSIFIYIKGFLLVTAFTNLYMLFDRELSIIRTIDQGFYLMMVILLSVSLIKHRSKVGVYLFYVYAMIELSLSYVTWVYAYINHSLTQDITTLVLSYTLGTLAYLIPIAIYYKKRLRYLN